MFYRKKKKNLAILFNTLRLELWLVHAYRRVTVARKRFITAACVSLEVALPKVFSRGLHLDLEVLEWLKLVEIWGAPKMGQKNYP